MIDRRIGSPLLEHHSAISTNDGSGMFQNDQIFANGRACGVKDIVLIFQLKHYLAFADTPEWLADADQVSWRGLPDSGFKMITSQAKYNFHNEIIHVSV